MESKGEGQDSRIILYKWFIYLILFVLLFLILNVCMNYFKGKLILFFDARSIYIILLISIVIFLSIMILILKIKRYFIKKLPFNVFENNKFVNLEEK